MQEVLLIVKAENFNNDSDTDMNFTNNTDEKNYSGVPVDLSDYLYIAAIRRHEETICIGGIISVYFVVTNAQCLYSNRSVDGLYIRVSSADMNQGGYVRWVKKIIFHKKFLSSSNSNKVESNNIALVNLKMPLTGEVNFDLISLFTENEDRPGKGVSVGWTLKFPENPRKLQKADVKMLSFSKCKKKPNKYLQISEDHVCLNEVIDKNVGKCWDGFGDGSLLVIQENEDNKLYGIFIAIHTNTDGRTCGNLKNNPLPYTSIRYHQKWLEDNANLNEETVMEDPSEDESNHVSNNKKWITVTLVVVGSAASAGSVVFIGAKVYGRLFK